MMMMTVMMMVTIIIMMITHMVDIMDERQLPIPCGSLERFEAARSAAEESSLYTLSICHAHMACVQKHLKQVQRKTLIYAAPGRSWGTLGCCWASHGHRLYLTKINDFCYSQLFLGHSWAAFGRSRGSLGCSWVALGRSWPALGPLLAALGRSWAALGRSWPALGRS